MTKGSVNYLDLLRAVAETALNNYLKAFLFVNTQSPMFITPRLTLRAHRESDIASLNELSNSFAVQRDLTPDYVVPRSIKFTEELLKRNEDCIISCTVTLTSTGELMGFAKLSPTTAKNRNAIYGVGLKQEYWGKGYGTEITEFMVDYAFRMLNLHRVTLWVFEHNASAIAIYKKIGFVLEGTTRKSNWIDGKWEDVYSMGILDTEWAERAASRK
ncbi:hypothetical protein HWV62_41625 [Athelia sp. TMB]|nr:hypothetical protein HWV62_41625 [Athelia sp. TMB]